MDKVVLAYSGGLDTSAAIPWLRERHRADVIALTLDLGQGQPLDRVRARALEAGAIRAHVLDVREEFAAGYLLPALQAGASIQVRPVLATALTRPLIAQKLVEIAGMERATIVAHGGAGHDRDRFDRCVRSIDPAVRVVAPAGEWSTSPAERMACAKTRGTGVDTIAGDVNLWARSIDGGDPDDPWTEPSEEVYALTKSPAEAPAEPASVELEFDRGVPTTINGIAMPLTELIASLATIAGVHGVGRIDSTDAGSRRLVEAPAALVLHGALRDLAAFTLPRDLQRLMPPLAEAYADLIDEGRWFTPARSAIDALVGQARLRMTGTVRLRLWKGDCRVVGRQSPFAPQPDEPGSARALRALANT